MSEAGDRGIRDNFSSITVEFTRLIFLGKGREPTARRYSENHKRLLEIVDEMTIFQMELLKANAVDSEN